MSTKIGQIAQEVARLNPWWRDPAWATRDPDLREAHRAGIHYRSEVLQGLTAGGLYLLRGPRRVGKTVAVKQQIDSMLESNTPATSIVRLAVDGWSARDLRNVVQNAALPPAPAGWTRTWFIDEISAVTGEWAQQIKWLRDNDADFREATVVLTGSNASALTDAAGTLAGRRGAAPRLDRTLLPLGFRTFVRLVSRAGVPDIPAVGLHELRAPHARDVYASGLRWLDVLVSQWETYLTYGGFPRSVAAAAQGQAVPSSFVDDMFSVIAGDAFRQSKLSVPIEMALIERLWMSMGSPSNLSNIAGHIGTSHDVIARHVGYLRDAYLLWPCPQRERDAWLPRPRAQDKIYAVDPLVARLAHLRNAERADVDPTVLTEMQLGMALRRRVMFDRATAGHDDFLFHVRTPSRKEIDFVSDELGGVAIEAKYIEDGSWKSEAATVDASEWDGILVTRNVLATNGDAAWAVPAGILAYAIDT